MVKVLFHSHGNGKHCPDGFGAALAAWIRFRDEAQYIPCVYGEPAPVIEPDDKVFLLDFSYPRDVLIGWSDIAYVEVLDHHKTAQEQLKNLPFAIFDMNQSGAQMAWRRFVLVDAPPLVEYVADRDLWRKELPHTEEVHRALATFPQDFTVWETLSKLPNYVDFMRRIGEPLYASHLADVEALAATAQKGLFMGQRVYYTNTDKYSFVSDALNLLCRQHPEAAFALNWFERFGRVKIELRSVGEFDVSRVAKEWGGGGHKNAAGCELKDARFLTEFGYSDRKSLSTKQ